MMNYANTMVLFDEHGVLRVYKSTTEITKEHFNTRMKLYVERREHLLSEMKAHQKHISNRARFISEMVTKKIEIFNIPKKDVIEKLKSGHYASDPIKAWKFELGKNNEYFAGSVDNETFDDYGYLLDMSIYNFTTEQKAKLENNEQAVRIKHAALEKTTPRDMWLADLEQLEKRLNKRKRDQVPKGKKNRKIEPSKVAKGRVTTQTVATLVGCIS